MLTKNKGLSKKDLIPILIKFKKNYGRFPTKEDFGGDDIEPSIRTFQRKFGTIGSAFEEANKYKTVDEFDQKLEEEEKKRQIKSYRRKFKKESKGEQESPRDEEMILQKRRRKTAADKHIGFQCSFCGNHISGANEYYSTLTKIIYTRLINLAKSVNDQSYCDGVLDSLFMIFGPEKSAVRRELEVAGLLERFDQRNIFKTDIENG